MQLIELLLLIGTLAAAVHLEKDLIWLYMLFALCSIGYFIAIQKPFFSESELKWISTVSFIIGGLFSGVINGNLFLSLPKVVLPLSLSLVYVIIVLILFVFYFIGFSMILWIALKKYDDFEY
ncbi:MAG: hypothetical protein FIB07_04410 [Candidatus Methanoperedens sp.]|nr:hypothetical protein [Candidatus Methanoperedens sp.]